MYLKPRLGHAMSCTALLSSFLLLLPLLLSGSAWGRHTPLGRHPVSHHGRRPGHAPVFVLAFHNHSVADDFLPTERWKRQRWVTGDPKGFTKTQAKVLLDSHNHFRSAAKASNMLKMHWDPKLAKYSQEVAERCTFQHTATQERKDIKRRTGYIYTGENIFITSAKGFEVDLAVEQWWEEIYDYDYDTGECKPNKMCGHYTQVLWGRSRGLGCGVSLCDRVPWMPKGWKKFYVVYCHYGPGGNIILNGNRLKPFFKEGVCKKCPYDAHFCEDNLCVTGSMDNVESIVNADDFCKERLGDESFLCMHPKLYNGVMDGDDLCRKIFCAKDGNPAVCVRLQTTFSDGLYCGTGKICKTGKCVVDEEHRKKKMTAGCLFGDQTKIFCATAGGLVTCDDVRTKMGLQGCTDRAIRQQCCQTCNRLMGLASDVEQKEPGGEVCATYQLQSPGSRLDKALGVASVIHHMEVKHEAHGSCSSRLQADQDKIYYGFEQAKDMAPSIFVDHGCTGAFEVCYSSGRCQMFLLGPESPTARMPGGARVEAMTCKRQHSEAPCTRQAGNTTFSFEKDTAQVWGGCNCDFLICFSHAAAEIAEAVDETEVEKYRPLFLQP